MAKDWDRNYVHSVDWRWLTSPRDEGPGESWLTPRVSLVSGESISPLQRLFAVADCANGLGSKLDIRKWTFLNTDLAVHLHRRARGRVDRNPGRDQLRPRRYRRHAGHTVRRERCRGRHSAVGAGPAAAGLNRPKPTNGPQVRVEVGPFVHLARLSDPACNHAVMTEIFLGREALGDGLPRRELRRWYRPLFRGVYIPRSATPTLEDRATGAWLTSNRTGVIAGAAASALHGAKWVGRH